MDFETWLYFFLADTFLSISPGPAVFMVVSFTMMKGKQSGLLAITAVLLTNAIYFTLSATSLLAIVAMSAEVFQIIKWLGALYLGWLGLSIIYESFQSKKIPDLLSQPDVNYKRGFFAALATQGCNPKMVVFFIAILPQFINTSVPIVPQVAILGVTSMVAEFFILWAYMAGAFRVGQNITPKLKAWVERAGGLFLIGAGVGLAATKSD